VTEEGRKVKQKREGREEGIKVNDKGIKCNVKV
jgi:hypothetical protein